jgi:hypothetical protein
LAEYCRKFSHDRVSANLLLAAIRQDPAYDASAAAYINALDVCEPLSATGPYRRVIQTAERRSAEQSLRLSVAAYAFRGHRASPTGAVRLVAKLSEPLAKSLTLHALFVGSDSPLAMVLTLSMSGGGAVRTGR